MKIELSKPYNPLIIDTLTDLNCPQAVAIWNTSFGKVDKLYKKTLQIYDKALQDRNSEHELLNTYELLLHNLCTLIKDDTGKILSLFITGHCDKNEHIKNFNIQTKPFKSRVGKQINKVKHNQRKITGHNFTIRGKKVLGYSVVFLEDDGYKPCLDVHNTEGDGAFSFNYELRSILVNLYQFSRELSNCLKNLSKAHKEIIATTVNKSSYEDLLEISSRIDELYFPNELKKRQPVIKITSEGKYLLEFKMLNKKNSSKILKSYGKITQEMQYTGDGITRNFKIIDVY